MLDYCTKSSLERQSEKILAELSEVGIILELGIILILSLVLILVREIALSLILILPGQAAWPAVGVAVCLSSRLAHPV